MTTSPEAPTTGDVRTEATDWRALHTATSGAEKQDRTGVVMAGATPRSAQHRPCRQRCVATGISPIAQRWVAEKVIVQCPPAAELPCSVFTPAMNSAMVCQTASPRRS